MDHGARYEPIVPGKIDHGRAVNTLTQRGTISKNATGMVAEGFLVEVERDDIDELRQKYPEAFKRPYNPGAGLCRERVLVEKKQI